jgi:spore coat polysaccharide biosynthesis protein SpsF
VLAFVQARMGSTRLPGKVLEPLAGEPVLIRIIERLDRVQGLDETIVLTSIHERDDVIASLCDAAGVRCIRGSEDDVLDRFATAAQQLRPELIVRITADCPLIDTEVVGALLDLYRCTHGLAYASVATGAVAARPGFKRFPDGLDAEVISPVALAEAWREADSAFDREHVTPFIWRQRERYRAATLECEVDLGDERWTLDHPADLVLVRTVYDRLCVGECVFGWRDVLAVLERDPALRRLNHQHRAAPSAPDSTTAEPDAAGEARR